MCITLSHQKFKIDNVNFCKLHYQLILKKFLDNLKMRQLSEGYIRRNKKDLRIFFKYLMKKNVFRIKRITYDNILNYIFTKDGYSKSTKYNLISNIRCFLRFAYLNKLIDKDFSLSIPKFKINHNNKIPHTIWSSDEISKILSCIDRSSQMGKRNYAIFMLLAHLGLRFSDVKNLKFRDIDWQMNILNITQNKTKKVVTLPLLENVGLALIDYIKNGRPNVNTQYVFLNKKNKKLSDKHCFYNTFRKYLNLANIDISNKKCIGTYSLRHSLATTLLQNRTPLSTISGILGHTDVNNTDIYLKVDTSSLKECCLRLEVN